MNDVFGAFDPVAIDNIIKVHKCYITAYENKVKDIEKQIRDFEDRSTNGSKSSEIVDALFSCLDEMDITDYV